MVTLWELCGICGSLFVLLSAAFLQQTKEIEYIRLVDSSNNILYQMAIPRIIFWSASILVCLLFG